MSFTNPFPSGCDASALQVNGTAAAGSTPAVTINFSSPSLSVPAASGSTPGTLTYPATLALADNHAKQDACKNLPLAMSYSASAYYTVPTSTALVASPSPAIVGQPVTLKATVSPTITPASAGGGPVGSVTFYRCSAPVGGCNTIIASNLPVTSGVTSIKTTFNSQATYYLQAVYTPTDTTSFSSSTSSIVTEAANYTTCVTSPQAGGITIGSGQTDCITATGRVAGNVTVNAGGRLDLLGGSVGSNVTVNSGGGLYVSGGNIAGDLVSNGANLFTVCSARLSSNVSASATTAWVLVGDSDSDASPTCSPNSIAGNLSLTNNSAGVEIGANTVNGSVTLAGTTGSGPGGENAAPEIEKNTISGGLSCSANTPTPVDDGQPNKVSGKRSGQCAGSF